jgi:hypothetical protein
MEFAGDDEHPVNDSNQEMDGHMSQPSANVLVLGWLHPDLVLGADVLLNRLEFNPPYPEFPRFYGVAAHHVMKVRDSGRNHPVLMPSHHPVIPHHRLKVVPEFKFW